MSLISCHFCMTPGCPTCGHLKPIPSPRGFRPHSAPPRRPACAELGNVMPDQRDVSCGSKLRICLYHDSPCTTLTEVPGAHCCRTCPEYRPING